MRPENTNIWRKGLRIEKRGTRTGRRTTHLVRTTYGQQQRIRDWNASWAVACAQFEAEHGPVVINYPATS